MFCFLCEILVRHSSDCSTPTNKSVKHKVAAVMGEGGENGAPVRVAGILPWLVMTPMMWVLLWRLGCISGMNANHIASHFLIN